MIWLIMAGWLYAVVGLIVGFFLFAFYTIHSERCDECVFGKDIPNWERATKLAKFGVVFSLGSAITWPIAVLYTTFLAWPATWFERWFAKPKDTSIQSIMRAWYKRNRKKGWQMHVTHADMMKGENNITVQIWHSNPTANIKISNDKCELEWRLPSHKFEGDWRRKAISPSDPKFFDTISQFMDDVSSGKQHSREDL